MFTFAPAWTWGILYLVIMIALAELTLFLFCYTMEDSVYWSARRSFRAGVLGLAIIGVLIVLWNTYRDDRVPFWIPLVQLASVLSLVLAALILCGFFGASLALTTACAFFYWEQVFA